MKDKNTLDSTHITDEDTKHLFEEKPTSSLSIPRNEFELLAWAVQHNGGIDIVERLSALKEKAEMRNAELAFNHAMNAAQDEIPRIAPDLDNSQTHSKYASYAAIDKKIRPVYIRHGFSLSFSEEDSPKPDHIRIICHCSHRDGHTRMYRKDMPCDGKGAKGGDVMTKTHAAGAADSYAKRYLVKDIFNIAIGEDDNDGNSGLGESFVDQWRSKMEEETTFAGLKKVFAECFKIAQKSKDGIAMANLQRAYEARKAVVCG